MFEREFNFFVENQERLVQQYNGKTIILQGENVVKACDSPLEAYLYAQKNLIAGSYMLQNCVPGRDAYTVSIATVGLAPEFHEKTTAE